MNYKVIPIDKFKKEAKRLKKKFPSLKEELIALERVLILNPESGSPLGNYTYKDRISIKGTLCKTGVIKWLKQKYKDQPRLFPYWQLVNPYCVNNFVI